ncbi:SDR family oxidoreductase [Numidum massiliense]|uniref:SDR family oxidoreductase n=1 Tax=Numidum massiliense TaxID=1522315 RepID=UPI0036F449C5
MRVAIVTGSSRGLGKKTALALAADGFRIVVNYRDDAEAAADVVTDIRADGGEAMAVKADVTKRENVQQLVAQVMAAWQRIDVLVNNVGPFMRERKRFAAVTAAETDVLLDGNLRSALDLVREVLPHMRHNGWGRIVQFGFGRAVEAPAWPDRAVYAAAKVALVSFTKSLAVEEAPYGITVNMICPGDIVGANKEKDIADVRHLTDPEAPRGRPGAGEDVARVVRFLCEENADFLTGNIINVTGGLDVIHPVSKAPM